MATMKITDGKGIHLTFDNGVTLSIQIGPGNYCDNYDEPFEYRRLSNYVLPPSTCAEIALWGRNKDGMVSFGCDTVKGRVSIEEVLRFADFLRNLPGTPTNSDLEQAVQSFDWTDREAA